MSMLGRGFLVLLLVAIVLSILGSVTYAGHVALGPTFTACAFVAAWTVYVAGTAYRMGLSAPKTSSRPLTLTDQAAEFVLHNDEDEEEEASPHEQALIDRRRGA